MYADNDTYTTYASQLSEDMKADRRMIKRNGKIRVNLQAQVAEADGVFLAYQQCCKVREERRVYYDHYRLKLEKLNEKAAQRANKPVTSSTYTFSNQDKEYQKLMRNQTKFEESELQLSFEKKQVDGLSKELKEKLEELRINLSVKFF